jgi:hypothetical protein
VQFAEKAMVLSLSDMHFDGECAKRERLRVVVPAQVLTVDWTAARRHQLPCPSFAWDGHGCWKGALPKLQAAQQELLPTKPWRA